jgi:hypothetical protein
MVREREHGHLGGVTDGTWRSWSVSAGVSCRSAKPAHANGSRTRIGHRRCLGCGTEFGSCQARRSPPRLIQRVWPPVDRDGSKRAIDRARQASIPASCRPTIPLHKMDERPHLPPRHPRPLPTGVCEGVRRAGIDSPRPNRGDCARGSWSRHSDLKPRTCCLRDSRAQDFYTFYTRRPLQGGDNLRAQLPEDLLRKRGTHAVARNLALDLDSRESPVRFFIKVSAAGS